MLIMPQIKCSHDKKAKSSFFPHFKPTSLLMYLFSIYPFDKFEADAMGNTEPEYTRFATIESLLVYSMIGNISIIQASW